MSLKFSHILLAICIGILIIVAGCSEAVRPRMLFASYSYSLDIQLADPVANVTFIVPIPVRDNVPKLGRQILSKENFTFSDGSVTILQSPPGLILSDAYYVPENEPWFLEIRSNSLPPNFSYHAQVNYVESLKSPLQFADTLIPVGNDSVFLPLINFTPPPIRKVPNWAGWRIGYEVPAAHYSTMIFARYEGSTRISIRSGMISENTWVEQSDSWIHNECRDAYSLSYTGESPGWQSATGNLQPASDGLYPNFQDPTWQQAIQRANVSGYSP